MTFQGVGGGLYLAILCGAVLPLTITTLVAVGLSELALDLANGRTWGDYVALAPLGLVPFVALGCFVATVHKVLVYYWPEVTLDGRRCTYQGNPWRLLVVLFFPGVLLVLTLGLSTPWFLARFYRWVASQVDIDGERMTFNGTGGQIFGAWLVTLLLGWVPVLGPVAVGLWIHQRIAAWRWQHTTLAGRPMAFASDYGDLLGALAVPTLLSLCTAGIYTPWVIARIWSWEAGQVR